MTSKIRPAADPGDPRLTRGEAWSDFCDALKQAGELVLGAGAPDSPRDRAEGFREVKTYPRTGSFAMLPGFGG